MSSYIVTPYEYAKELFDKGNYKKAGAYLQYQVDIFEGKSRTYREYEMLWKVSKSNCYAWVKDFKIAIKNHNETWQKKNEKHVNFEQKLQNAKQNAKQNAETSVGAGFEAGEQNDQQNAQQNGHTIYINNIKYIVEFLNAKTASKYKHTSAKTQTLIKARFKDGFTLEDFKQVIETKTAQWLGTEMEKYLRPETLFGTKFEGYLNESTRSNGGDTWSW